MLFLLLGGQGVVRHVDRPSSGGIGGMGGHLV